MEGLNTDGNLSVILLLLDEEHYINGESLRYFKKDRIIQCNIPMKVFNTKKMSDFIVYT
jgi:hypothetical protein